MKRPNRCKRRCWAPAANVDVHAALKLNFRVDELELQKLKSSAVEKFKLGYPAPAGRGRRLLRYYYIGKAVWTYYVLKQTYYVRNGHIML